MACVGYATTGQTSKAVVAGLTMAAAMVGAEAVVGIAARAFSASEKAGRVASVAKTVATRATDLVEHVQISARLAYHTRSAARTITLTARRQAAVVKNPGMAAVFRGERIDAAVRRTVTGSKYLSSRLSLCARG